MTKERYSVLIALFALLVLYPVKSTAQNIPPIADAGLSRYAAQDPVVLDGRGSYDPDNSGTLTYAWRQIAGPSVIMIDANTATPTIGGSSLIAHWALDETEGSVAYDSAGDKDGTLNGNPTWQPIAGQIDGALAFDGTDDYVSTDFVLNPADGQFSVFAWIKGGAPGQVILSQIGQANWLSADLSEGNLMTELRNIGARTNQPPLSSQTLITDGAWHHIGFVWDGSDRILYADDVQVARDTQPGLGSSEGGLYIGAGSTLDPISFFSGLIDDIRIYNRAFSTIGDFTQTDAIQECEFELVVSDGELTGLPDTVKVIIVPTFSESTMVLENDSFDSQKPTIIFFGGYASSRWSKDTTGGSPWSNKAGSNNSAWQQRANIISFFPYVADDASSNRATATYYRCADMIIVYLSAVAPDYKEYIQTMGHSLGGMPAIGVARFLNEIYAERRYAINRVTLFDTTPYLEYSHRIRNGLIDRVDGEQCWIENYVCTMGWGLAPFYNNIFNVAFDKFEVTPYGSGKHGNAPKWYGKSLTGNDMNLFNNGVVAGVYWSVIGQGKNLQLASTPDVETYKFTWYGDVFSGYMDFYDELNHPGRLPEPVTLVGPVDVGDPNGAILTCEESENAVGYQLLFGPDPYRVMDYNIISDTPTPPNAVITTLPFEETWWTVRAYDHYGSTIHADPMYIDASMLSFPIAGN